MWSMSALSTVMRFAIVIALFSTQAAAQTGEGQPLPVRMLTKAWSAYEQGQNAEAATFADKVIAEFGVEAEAAQKELSAKNEPLPGSGRVSQAEKERIFSFGPLNDVATAWWIKGRALEKQGKRDAAILALKRATEYPHARTYDKEWGGFWSPSEKAKVWIGQLQSPQ